MGLLTVPLGLMVVGVIVTVGGFLFAAVNMFVAANMAKSVRSAGTKPFGSPTRMFRRHLAAIAAMAIGGLLVLIGLISGAYLALSALFAPYGF